jgi:alpha-beta hydrolase superfamily lysophospholipase
MWLRDTLPYDMTSGEDKTPIARVMLYGYESTVAQSDSIQGLEDLGTAFHSSILQLATSMTPKPIIFVAHSLGGLIVKQVG